MARYKKITDEQLDRLAKEIVAEEELALERKLLALLPVAQEAYANILADPNYCRFCNRIHSEGEFNSGGLFVPEECEGDRR